MKRVSVRTLALLVELLIAVIAQQYIAAAARRPHAGAIWLASNRPAVARAACAVREARPTVSTEATPQ